MQNFNVDISTSHIPQVLYVKHGDSLSRFFALTIADNGSPWEPPENAAYTIRFSTSAGTGWYDTIQLVGGTTRPAVSAAGNVLTCEVAEQATLGNGQLCVMVNDSTGYQLGMWNLNIIAEVVPGANSQEAESYYGVLAGQIAQALAAEQGATEQANLAKQYADSIDPSQFATQAELDATQAQLAAKTAGHIIQNPDGTAMTQRAALQFVGFQVNDDPSGKTIVSPQTAGDTKNVAGYVGEISLFADNQLRENHVWADGSTINPATWPDLAAYATTAGWETDSGTGWYKTPVLSGTVYATGFDVGQMNAQIRAKVDIIEATAVEVNSNTLSGFEDGQVLAQQGGKIVGVTPSPAVVGLTLKKINISPASSKFTIFNPDCYSYRYGNLRVLSLYVRINSLDAGGWVDVITFDDSDNVAPISIRAAVDIGDNSVMRDVQILNDRVRASLGFEDVGKFLILNAVSVYTN